MRLISGFELRSSAGVGGGWYAPLDFFHPGGGKGNGRATVEDSGNERK